MTPFERLADAISGERRDWHKVEVRPDDIAALLYYHQTRPEPGADLAGLREWAAGREAEAAREEAAATIERSVWYWRGKQVAYREAQAALAARGVTVSPDLAAAAEGVDSAWHDEGDHIEYHDELAERLTTLRRALAALAALPASPEDGLDEERLAVAIASLASANTDEPLGFGQRVALGVTPNDIAAAIAREYAALGDKP